MSDERVHVRAYATTWVALVALASVSMVLSRTGRPWAYSVGLTIGGAKALLIALFFMHLSRARVSVRLGALTAAGLLAILSLFAAADIRTRVPPVEESPSAQ